MHGRFIQRPPPFFTVLFIIVPCYVWRVCSKCITHVLCFRVCRRWMLDAFAKPILFAVSQFPQPKSQSTPGPLEPLVSYHMRSPNIALVWCWLWLSHICFATHQPSSRFRKDFLNVQFSCKLFLNLNIWPALFFHIKHFTMHLTEPHNMFENKIHTTFYANANGKSAQQMRNTTSEITISLEEYKPNKMNCFHLSKALKFK